MHRHPGFIEILLLLLLSSTTVTAETESGAQAINGLGERQVVCESIPPLRYPSAITDGSLGGTVLVKVLVDETGRVYDTELVESRLPELFIVEALKTARLSRFRPARRSGKAIRGSILMPMIFPPRDPAAVPVVIETVPEPVALETAPEPEPLAEESAAVETPEPVAIADDVPRILDAGFGKGVQSRELQDRGEIFAVGERVYFWMELEGLESGQTLTQAWIFRGRAVQEIELVMKGEHWRSWSYKTLFPGLEGAWLLELRDDTGRLLGSWSFHCE
jgi:TonB family protein